MKKFLIVVGIILIVTGVVWLASRYPRGAQPMPSPQPEPIACTADAKQCGDGSYVGRIGPHCEFAACPNVSTEGTIARLNQTIVLSGVLVTPLEVLEDSRCPVEPNVQCVWAGRVRLRTQLEVLDNTKEEVLTLGTATSFLDKNITLVNVTPAKHSQAINDRWEYQFEFVVTNK